MKPYLHALLASGLILLFLASSAAPVAGVPHASAVASVPTAAAFPRSGVAAPHNLTRILSTPPAVLAPVLADPGSGPSSVAPASTPFSPVLQASSPLVTVGWDALHFGTDSGISNGWVPPDVQVAAGPNHVVEMVNLLMGVYTKQGAQVSVTPLSTLFNSGSDFISDPKVQYDAGSGHWFATVTDVTAGQALLFVSATSDPTGSWHRTRVPSTSTGECLDQPILGVGTTTVIVSVNVFTQTRTNPCTTPYLGAQYWVVNKTDLLAGAALPAMHASAPDVNEGSIHPVKIQGTSDAHYMVSTYWPGTATTSSTLHLFTVSGTPPGLVTVTVTSLSMPTAALPPPAPQRGTSHTLDTSDIRISDAVWAAGKLWLDLDEACLADASRACARLVEIDTSAKTILQDFDLDVAGKDVFYPAFRLDGQGNLAVVVGYSSSSDYPGILATGRVYGDAPNTYQTPEVVVAGTGPENPTICKSTCRYGDYFGAGLDPSDSSTVWLAGEMGTSSGWGTHIFATRIKAEITVVGLVQGGGTGYQSPTISYVLNDTTSSSTLKPTATVLADPGSAWSVTSILGGSTAQERWQTNNPLTQGVADASFNGTFVYYHQYAATFDAAVTGTPPSSPVVAVIQFGQQSWMATNAPTWADANTPFVYRNPIDGSTASERWYTHDAISGDVTGPLTVTLQYFHQFDVSFDFTVGGSLPYTGPAPAINATTFGTSVSLTLPATSWVDAGGAYAYPSALAGSNDSVRWGTGSGTSGTIASASAITVTYGAQYAVRLFANPAAAAVLLTGGGWYEPGSTASVAASSNASWGFQGWTGTYAGLASSFRLAVNGPITVSAAFYPGLTIVAGGGGSVSYAYGSTTGIVPAGASVTIYVAPGTQITLTASPSSSTNEFNGWTGAASGSSGSTTVTVNQPGTAAATFGSNLLVLVVLPAAILLAVVLLVLFVILRRRKKALPPAQP